jgi:hypothetical protein
MHDDDVDGQIIGGFFGDCWLTYDGRKQGPTMYAQDQDTAKILLNNLQGQIKASCGSVYRDIYPAQLWAHNFRGI